MEAYRLSDRFGPEWPADSEMYRLSPPLQDRIAYEYVLLVRVGSNRTAIISIAEDGSTPATGWATLPFLETSDFDVALRSVGYADVWDEE